MALEDLARLSALRRSFEALDVVQQFGPFALRDVGSLLERHTPALVLLERYLGEGHPTLTGHAITLDASLPVPRLVAAVSEAVAMIATSTTAPDIGVDLWASYLLWRHPETSRLVTPRRLPPRSLLRADQPDS